MARSATSAQIRSTGLLATVLAIIALSPAWTLQARSGPSDGGAGNANARVEIIESASGEVRSVLFSSSGQVFHRTDRQVLDLRTVDVPETAIELYLWDESAIESMTSDRTAHFAIAEDGRLRGRVRSTDYFVRLQDGAFDPMAESLSVSPRLEAKSENRHYFVQFVTVPLPEFRVAVEQLGARVHRFVTDHAYIVEMSDETREAVAALGYVRWIGPYHPQYRVEPAVRTALLSGQLPSEPQRYSLMAFERGITSQQRLVAAIEQIGGTVLVTTQGGYRIEATLDADQLEALLHSNELQYVDRWGGPGEFDMDVVRQVGGANYIEGLLGFTGQGVRGEIFDSELLVTHQEWSTTPIIHSNSTSGGYHGTSCYSINFAQGADGDSRGMVPDGQGIFFLYNESTQFGGPKSRYDINEELIDPAGPYRAVFQTSSVGSARTTQYTTISAETDDYLFQHQILSTQSQSNAGNQQSRPQAWAKNIVSVGGLYHFGTASRSDDSWSFGASIGPASDGRIKPDLAYFYDGIRAAHGSGNSSYTSFGGTSAATPETAGHFGLLFQLWHNGVWGQGGGASVFDDRPQMATAKALMINSAYRYDWNQGGSNSDISRAVQGWGTADVAALYDEALSTTVVDETDVIAPLETRNYSVFVGAGTPELRVTMVYTDPMGTVGAGQQRINDLSLRVTSPGGTVYWGNNGLTTTNTSTSGGTSNTVDTVENVFLVNPQSGNWTVSVIGDEIVQDGHVETGAIDADFALVITGGAAGPPPPDNDPPAPDPMTFDTFPQATGETSIFMEATVATDSSGVEYYFTALDGGNDSGWQSSTAYEDTGLAPGTTYTYTVTARDLSANQNETAPSAPAAATTDVPDLTPPSPDPMSFASVPQATGATSIIMTATTASDPNGVEYYFTALTAGGNDSGWQTSATYEDTGLSPNTTYAYTVRARDLSPAGNETGDSSSASATTDPPGFVDLTYDDFESGWGNFADGGRDCRRYTGGTHAHQGSAAANIQDNSGTSSSFAYSSGVDVHNPGYTQIRVEFWFKSRNFGNSNDDFWVQYFDGSTWHTVGDFDYGVDFQNGPFYSRTVVIDEASYTFPTNMRIRFMCDAGGNRDDVYIDEVRVSAQ